MKKTDNELIGERIREARNNRGLTKDELGLALGVHANTIYNYEQGISKIPADLVNKICKATGISTKKLLQG